MPLIDVQSRIDFLLRNRAAQVPSVRNELNRWNRFQDELDQLTRTLEELRSHPKTPDEARGLLILPQATEFRQKAAQLVESYRLAETRFLRPTINIGVSGVARVGKSTLLQSLTGLGEAQIPTGSGGIPVTAVRSRIFHSAALRRAVIRLHTEQSFLDEVIGPFHAKLGLTARPTSIEEFRHWRYAEPSQEDDPRPGEVEHTRRLIGMQRSLDSYAADLVGGDLIVDNLDQLRGWVAYPTNAELNAATGPVARRYLAVRDMRIDTRFPRSTVEQLGIIDLPGLGEIDPDAEQRHLAGLRNEVDVVLLVKRPKEGMAFWGDKDVQALALVDQARGYIRDRRDFVALVINRGTDDKPNLIADLTDDIRRQVNGGMDGKFLTVYTADAASADSTHTDLLQPLLASLADRLPVMDRQVLEGVGEEAAALADLVRAALADLARAIIQLKRSTAAPAEDLDDRVKKLREDLAVDLAAYREELKELVKGEQDDEDFVAAVETGYRDILTWVSGGFDEGKDAWCRSAERSMIAERNAAPFAVDQLNRIRVEVSRRFGTLDDFFTRRLDAVWRRLAEILRKSTGQLLDDSDGEQALVKFRALLDEGSEPCPALSRAVADVLDIRLDYLTLLYPRIRGQVVDLLNFEVVNPVTDVREPQIVVPTTEEGAQTLYTFIIGRARQAAHVIRNELLSESVAPTLVVQAFVEQFDDALIRSAESKRDFKRLARSFRDRIWPGLYEGIELDDARIARVTRAAEAVAERIDGSGSKERP
ncbi:MAG: hypothetical protein JO100_01425 [Pseudonocardia sp.]|nr:hypothetical protein [Pseudonocardia sp.]